MINEKKAELDRLAYVDFVFIVKFNVIAMAHAHHIITTSQQIHSAAPVAGTDRGRTEGDD
jgi:hypothetical protein